MVSHHFAIKTVANHDLNWFIVYHFRTHFYHHPSFALQTINPIVMSEVWQYTFLRSHKKSFLRTQSSAVCVYMCIPGYSFVYFRFEVLICSISYLVYFGRIDIKNIFFKYIDSICIVCYYNHLFVLVVCRLRFLFWGRVVAESFNPSVLLKLCGKSFRFA